MACCLSSQQTRACTCSSPLPRGVAGVSTACSTSPPWPSTPRPMGWWRGCTTRWRTPYVPGVAPPSPLGHAGHQSLPQEGVRHIRGWSGSRPSGRTLRQWPHQPWRGPLTSTIYMQRGGVGPPLAENYLGPYLLLLEKGAKDFKLQLGERTEVVTRDWLKPYVGQAPPAAAEPPQIFLRT